MVGVGGWYTCRGNHLAKVETNMEEIASVAQKGSNWMWGRIFSTSKSSIPKREGDYFHALVCSGKWDWLPPSLLQSYHGSDARRRASQPVRFTVI